MSDWQIIEFEVIARLAKQKFNPKKETVNKICIELEHITKETGRLIGSTSSKLQLSTKNVFNKGNVLFGKLRPNLRKYIYCNFDGVCSSEIWVLTPQAITHPKFLFYLVQQEKFISSACVVSGSKMPRADWNYVSKVPFSIPPLPEQKAIASLLETWDTAIEKTEALIEAKEKRFKWLLKTLISDQQGNPEWWGVKLEDIARFSNGYPFRSSLYTEQGSYCIVTIGSVQDGFMAIEKANKIAELPADIQHYQILHKGDILISMTGNVGRICLVNKSNCLLNQRVGKITPQENCDRKFLFYMLHRRHFLYEMISLAEGGAQGNLSKGSIMSYKVHLPSVSEQQHISNILDVTKKELDILKQLTEKYRAQKRGLMQKLLKG